MKQPRVLLVDDEANLLDLLELDMSRIGLDCDRAVSVREAESRLGRAVYDLCLCDMRLPDGDGLDIVRLIAERYPHTPVAVITAFGSAENAVAALKAGAFDYVEKPVTPEKIRSLVRSALKLPEATGGASTARPLVGDSPPMRQVRALIDKVALSQAPVFISGETGTGKEVAARMIHAQSSRSGAPFIAVNCGAIPENLMESEFFGYRKGAFTGADADRHGFFQAAQGGTLFLDEVADLPLPMQVKLLRVIQEKRVRQVGGVVEEPVDVRIISASHQDLQHLVASGRFRHDLYYRLNVIDIRMPALRERLDDLPLLAVHILSRLTSANRAAMPELDAAAMAALRRYDFPGNVRELENILERGMALADDARITAESLNLVPVAEVAGENGEGAGLQGYLDQVEARAIREALDKTGNNKTAAARLLGVTFRSLRYRIERLGLE